MLDDRHRSLKRWEKSQQMSTLARDPQLIGPAATCRVRSRAAVIGESLQVYIVQLFAQDLVCVKACSDEVPEGVPGPYWLVRGGIRWEDYLKTIVKHYQLGWPVPSSFQPRKKIGTDLVDQMMSLPGRDLPQVFAKLRESGLLPPLQSLNQANCPTALSWDNIRSRFQDFLKEAAPAALPQG